MTDLDICLEDPRSPDLIDLLHAHKAFAREWSLPENMYVLDAERLASEAISFFSARRQGRLLAVGALCPLDDEHVEIKSMHTAQEARGQGVGFAMLQHLLANATEQGYRRVSLETGTGDAFEPARSIYRRSGFKVCPPFGDHVISTDSVCMTLDLSTP